MRLIDADAAIESLLGITAMRNTIPLDSAIFNIKKLPSVQPEQHLDEWCVDCKEYDKEKHSCPRWNRVIRQTLLDAQPERKTGRWIDITNDESIDMEYKCSECGFEMFLWSDLTNFCPNCGAKMEGGE